MKPKRCMVLLLMIVVLLSAQAVYADAPYNSYTYDYWGTPVPSPAPYLPVRIIDGASLGVGNFSSPMDIFVSQDNRIYVADSGNNRIVVLNERFEVQKVIDGFVKDGGRDTFSKPQGVFVNEKGEIYIADTDNARIVHLDAEGNYIREIGPPEGEIIPEDFQYRPTALVEGKGQRLYVISQGVNQGLIEFDKDGIFKGFVGAPKVSYNFVDYVWKLIATQEQRERMQDFVPTEYNSIDIDEDGFMYVTTSTISESDIRNAINSRSQDDRYAPIRKLNPTGEDILRRYGYFPPVGDIVFRSRGYAESGNSQFVDVCVEPYGIYSVLDKRKGRIFTYDSDGNLLYVFGGLGNRMGTFRNPVSIDIINNNYVVLDSITGYITVFEPTEYGRLLKEAVVLHQQGKYDESTAKWEEVLKLNANLELAYVGMGKAYLRKDEFESAMKYFRLGNKRDYYSNAFKLFRKEVVGRNFGLFVMGIVIVSLLWWLYLKRKHRKEVQI